ncbi:MAG: D-alanyl-D-alanine carboxypeptidase [Ruminiclostridium sp.]|nr:D-alanyl-D-alanine carboxypeptidase [Ruminiclostridium sp.]
MKIISVTAALAAALVMLNTPVSALPDSPGISAECAVVINADTGTVLYEKNDHKQHAMASTTKIMTALLTLEAGDPNRLFVADSTAIKVEGTSMGLKEGDIVTRRALCCGMLLPSGNDAANAAAVSIAGSLSGFAELMNRRAAQLGMKDTHFVTPSGLDAEGHYSTAYDMAVLTREALKNEEFRRICGSASIVTEFGNPPAKRTLYNSNKLLGMYEGCIGVKTGFTDNARRCLVSAAERNGCTLIAVTLNAPDDWSDHRKLLDSCFEGMRRYSIRLNSFSAEVVGGTERTVSIVPEEELALGLTAEEARRISVKYTVPDFVYAEVSKGDRLGRADVYLDGRLLERVALTAFGSVSREEPSRGMFDWLKNILNGGFMTAFVKE